MIPLFAALFSLKAAGADAEAIAGRAMQQTLTVLLGVGLAIVAIVMIISGTKTGSLAGQVATIVATKGKTIAS